MIEYLSAKQLTDLSEKVQRLVEDAATKMPQEHQTDSEKIKIKSSFKIDEIIQEDSNPAPISKSQSRSDSEQAKSLD